MFFLVGFYILDHFQYEPLTEPQFENLLTSTLLNDCKLDLFFIISCFLEQGGERRFRSSSPGTTGSVRSQEHGDTRARSASPMSRSRAISRPPGKQASQCSALIAGGPYLS